MFDLEMTEDQRLIHDTVASFAKAEIRPIAHDCDESGTIPAGLAEKGFELGLVHSAIPEEQGGYGETRSSVTGAIVAEELAWGDMDTREVELASQHQKCLAMVDITPQLQLFAVQCAELVLPIFENEYPKDRRPRVCIEMAKQQLDSKTSGIEQPLAFAYAAAAYDVAFSLAFTCGVVADLAAKAAPFAVAAAMNAFCAASAKKAANDAEALTNARYIDAAVYAAACAEAHACAKADNAQAIQAAFKRVRTMQEKKLISLLPAEFNAWK